MSQKQQLNIPAIQLPIFGLKDQSHLIRHQTKLQQCPFDAGVDLYPSSIDRVIEYVGWSEVWIGTKLHIAFQPGFYGRICDRSSTSRVTAGATVLSGVIDAGYTGEIVIRLQVIMPRPYDDFADSLHPVATALRGCIEEQVSIAQIIPTQALTALLMVVDPATLPKLGNRGANGFGSTNSLKP